MEEKLELELIGEIDHIKLYYDPLMSKKSSITGFRDAVLPPAGSKVKTCTCENCKCVKNRGVKTYSDIKFKIMGTKDIENFKKSLDKYNL